MSDESADDILADAAVVDDADLRTPAVSAALLAATEAFIDMPSPSDHLLEPVTSVADQPDLPPDGPPRLSGPRRALLAAAAVSVVVAGAVGIAALGDDVVQPDQFAPSDRSVASTSAPESGPPPTDVLPTCPIEVPVSPSVTDLDEAIESLPQAGPVPCRVDDPDPGPYPPPTLPPGDADAPGPGAPLADRIEFAARQAFLGNVARIKTTGHTKTLEILADNQTATLRAVLAVRVEGSDDERPFTITGPAAFDGISPDGAREVRPCSGRYVDYERYNPRITPFLQLASDLRTGVVVEDGRETIDGRDTLRFRNTNPALGAMTWLDAETLLPVRSTSTSPGNGLETTTYELLPRTPDNLALLVPSTDGLMPAEGPDGPPQRC